MAINDIRNDTLSEYFIWRKEPDGRWVKTADKPLDHLTIKWNGLRTGRFYRRNVWIDEVVYSPHDHTPEWWEDGRGYILVYDPVKKRK